MAVYDSARVRRAARLMRQMAIGMEAEVRPVLDSAWECLSDLHGRTAQAMEERLEALVRSSEGLQTELSRLSAQIDGYADMLEEADRQLAREL